MKQVPRGIRNNNPLNIRKSNNAWQHKVTNGSDPVFEQFDSLVWGIRAAFVLVKNYIDLFHKQGKPASVENIVSRWAPAIENDCAAYIAAVEKKSHGFLQSETELEFYQREKVVLIVWCMAYVENGVELPSAKFYEAYDLV